MFFTYDGSLTETALIAKDIFGKKEIQYNDILSLSTKHINDGLVYEVLTSKGSYKINPFGNDFEAELVQKANLELEKDHSNMLMHNKRWKRKGSAYIHTSWEDKLEDFFIYSVDRKFSSIITIVVMIIIAIMGIFVFFPSARQWFHF